MFLRNYDNYMLAIHVCPSAVFNSKTYDMSSRETIVGNGIEFVDGQYNIKSTNGAVTTSIYVAAHYDYNGLFYPPLMINTGGICLGDGTADVTYDDYRLSGNLISNKLVEVSNNISYDATTNKWKRTLVATYTNSGDEGITISEWGLWHKNTNGVGNNSFSNSSSNCALVYRELLDEPIVIEAGTTATLTFSIEIPMPNHP